jgi:lipopolysaccharide export system protein LptA
MFRRTIRFVIVLAALVASYQAYVLFAVPLMDPPLAVPKPSAKPSRPSDPNGATRYQQLLSNYFPKDHWTQTRPPKVFASSDEKAMLVLDDYKRYAEQRVNNERFTQVDISTFALLVFPTPPRAGILPPRDAFILEAPQGAKLKFDDFRPELGRIGQITGGQFPGRITIRSDMREPGPEDDLLIETSDLQMNTKLLYSLSPVRFRMGPNVGGGRELEISFLIDEHLQPKDSKLKISGIDTLEIRRDVKMRMQLEADGLLPGDDAKAGPPAPGGNEQGAQRNSDALPIEATCSGSFTFDFVRYVATLDRDVDLRQINANGPGDQLFCNKLDVYFAPRSSSSSEPQPVIVDPSKRQQRDLGRLEPVAVEASGHPVVVNSPQKNARARGDRIQIALKEQRVRVAGAREATLVYGPNVLQAPMIDYQHPQRDSATPIGRFRATGAGTLQYVPDPTRPDQVLQATWQTMVDLGRENGQPVLTLEGRPQFAFTATGALIADHMKIYLHELLQNEDAAKSNAANGAAPQDAALNAGGIPLSLNANDGKMQIIPDRLRAHGNVEIQSPRMVGRTGELNVIFKAEPTAVAAAADNVQSADTPAAKPAESLAEKLSRGIAAGPLQQVFQLSSDKMKLDVAIKGPTASPTTLSCDGNVVFREVLPPGAKEQPMEITGTQLIVDRLDSTPYITLKGGKAAGITNRGPDRAQLSGRGVTMNINVLEIDARENRMWSDGAGTATLLVTRALDGQATATPFPLDLTWQGGLQFDGTTMLFDRDVEVAGADDRMQCDRLLAKLNTKIEFGAGIDQRAIDVAEIHCDGGVTINHLTRDTVGVTSHERVQIASLSINQQTGAIAGAGPGVIRSTRFGDGLAALGAGANSAAPRFVAPPPDAGAKLHYLQVDFLGGLTGNIITRELTFREQVRTVYGPVDSWEQELDGNRPETLPPESMRLSSDAMRINEDPIAVRNAAVAVNGEKPAIGPIQFRADGNVVIEGQEPGRGPFHARADVARYEQAKDTFVLEGGRTPATLTRAGNQSSPYSARSIFFNRSTGDYHVKDVQPLEITPEDWDSARRPEKLK